METPMTTSTTLYHPNPHSKTRSPPTIPDVILLCLIDILGDRSTLDLVTAARHYREYGVEKVLTTQGGKAVVLRTPRQVDSFARFILAAPQKRGHFIARLSIALPAFESENLEDAKRLAQAIPHLTELRRLYLSEPEAGLASYPPIIDAFRSLRSVRILGISGADEWTNLLLSRLRAGLHELYIYRRAAWDEGRGFSMSFSLWRFAYSLRKLFVDCGFAACLEHNGGGTAVESDDAGYEADTELERKVDDGGSEDEPDVDSVVVSDVNGPRSEGTSATCVEVPPPVLDASVTSKDLSVGRAFEESKELTAVDGSPSGLEDKDTEHGDRNSIEAWVADVAHQQGHVGHGVVNANNIEGPVPANVSQEDHGASNGEVAVDDGYDHDEDHHHNEDHDDEDHDDEDHDDDDYPGSDAESAVSDYDEVIWASKDIPQFNNLTELWIPDLVRDSRASIVLATPALTYLDVGAAATVYTPELRRTLEANKSATSRRFNNDASKDIQRWRYLKQVRGGLVDLAVLGNTVAVDSIEVVGIITDKVLQLLPTVVADHSPTILRATMAFPFTYGLWAMNDAAAEEVEEMNNVQHLTLRVVVKKDIHKSALKKCLVATLRAFEGLARVFIDLMYDEDDCQSAGPGSLDGIDLDGFAKDLVHMVKREKGEYCQLFYIKQDQRVSCLSVERTLEFRGGEEHAQWKICALDHTETQSKEEEMLEIGMFSETYPL
ncbi:hypothetical protein L226DRAFT_524584 [Lentinus tigrinus ALCF2SS1-7]|uniref:Uncharacterized protein n=1 Tax=Lentinus tigrinus ALCF2SS1-6 TaxID=1328759 RepID=A0A5C2RV35_9APHY|nr:hypothetical protein L227DRAFT_566520 [Lentinus tigrinus ALCF2SS1-6]RPD72525.1 hypothetical protein L226DRAFT_524584 [Lentinus tigrinus ALCF2SS1-7]